MRWFIVLMLFSGIAQAISVQGLIDKYGKNKIMPLIVEKTGGQVRIEFYGEITKRYAPSKEYITAKTIKLDLLEIGLSANDVEKIIIQRSKDKYELDLKDKMQAIENRDRKLKYENQQREIAAEVAEKESATYKEPLNYRATIERHLKGILFDPYSVRDKSISRPHTYELKKDMFGLSRGQRVSLVKVEFYAKNRFGAYIGKSKYVYVFRGERLIKALKD